MINLSEKTERMLARARSMSDDEISEYLYEVCTMPHLHRIYEYWLERFTKNKQRRAFFMALFAYEDNKMYGWLRNGGIEELDISHAPLAYAPYEQRSQPMFVGGL